MLKLYCDQVILTTFTDVKRIKCNFMYNCMLKYLICVKCLLDTNELCKYYMPI